MFDDIVTIVEGNSDFNECYFAIELFGFKVDEYSGNRAGAEEWCKKRAEEITKVACERISEMKLPCWLVWQRAADNGRPYLVAVDTSVERAQRHVGNQKGEALRKGDISDFIVEGSWLNHLYGETMTKTLDELKRKARESKR